MDGCIVIRVTQGEEGDPEEEESENQTTKHPTSGGWVEIKTK